MDSDRIALIADVGVLTHRALAAEVRAVARVLAARHGVAHGVRVAGLLASDVSAVLLVHALAELRAVCIPLNTRLVAGELSSLLVRSRPALLVVDAAHRRLAEEALSAADVALLPAGGVRLLATEELVDEARELVADTRELPMDTAARDAGADARAHGDAADASTDIQTILFTSGTTGRPRMVPLTFANHRASVRASAANLGVRPGDRWLCVLPLFHAGGLAILHRARHDGSAVELHGRFDAAACARALRGGVTLASFVPTMLARVLEADPALDAAAAPALRAVLLGGAAADASLWAEIARRGLPVLGTWGMTETASQAVTVHPAEALRKPGAAGRVLSGMELRVVGPDGQACAAGEEGALQVRGAMLTPGWLDDDAAWRARMHDGWFDTGDVGALDDEGTLWVGARREDLIITGGENVAPPEVEAVLAAHPAVAAVCVAGVRDTAWGQVVGAAVVLRSSVSTEELEAHCRARLAGYKVPRRWLVLDALPMTASGKVRRAMVRGMMEGAEKKNAEDAEGTEQD